MTPPVKVTQSKESLRAQTERLCALTQRTIREARASLELDRKAISGSRLAVEQSMELLRRVGDSSSHDGYSGSARDPAC